MSKPRSFELKRDTVKFFYEVDSYWQAHSKEKSNITIEKLKPLYKGFVSFMISSHREFFLYRNPSKFIVYKILKAFFGKEASDYTKRLDKSYFRMFYNSMCSYYFKVLKAPDIVAIHEEFQNNNYDLLEDTYSRCTA